MFIREIASEVKSVSNHSFKINYMYALFCNISEPCVTRVSAHAYPGQKSIKSLYLAEVLFNTIKMAEHWSTPDIHPQTNIRTNKFYSVRENEWLAINN